MPPRSSKKWSNYRGVLRSWSKPGNGGVVYLGRTGVEVIGLVGGVKNNEKKLLLKEKEPAIEVTGVHGYSYITR